MLFRMLNVLHFYIITSRSVCAVSDMADFCSSLLHSFPVSCSGIYWMTLRWFQFTHLLLVFFFTFHIRSICTVSFLYFIIFSASFLITFLSPEIALSVNMRIPCHARFIVILSVCTCSFHNMVTLPSRFVSTNFGTWSFDIIIIIILVTLMQRIYNYIAETNHVSRIYSIAAVLYLQSLLHVMLFRPWNMFYTFILALSAVCVPWPIRLLLVVPWFSAFPVCCSGIVWVIVIWFRLPLLLPVSLLLSHSTCAEFIQQAFYILK